MHQMQVDFTELAVPWLDRAGTNEGWAEMARADSTYAGGRNCIAIAAALWFSGRRRAAVRECLDGLRGPAAAIGVTSPTDTSGVSYEQYAEWFRRNSALRVMDALGAAIKARSGSEKE